MAARVRGAVTLLLGVTATAGALRAHEPHVTTAPDLDARLSREVTSRDHDVHVSVSRVAVEGREIYWRIRCFTDDLELALRQHARDSAFTFARARPAAADSLVRAYVASRLQLHADGVRLPVQLVSTGTEADESGEQVRWYVFTFTAAAPPASLTIRHAVLFDIYRDQQNLVTLLHSATNRRLPLYFTAGNDIAQTVTFSK